MLREIREMPAWIKDNNPQMYKRLLKEGTMQEYLERKNDELMDMVIKYQDRRNLQLQKEVAEGKMDYKEMMIQLVSDIQMYQTEMFRELIRPPASEED